MRKRKDTGPALQNALALDVEEIAHALRLGRAKVYEEIRTGRLETYTVGRRRYARVAAIEQWQRDRVAESAKQQPEDVAAA